MERKDLIQKMAQIIVDDPDMHRESDKFARAELTKRGIVYDPSVEYAGTEHEEAELEYYKLQADYQIGIVTAALSPGLEDEG